MLNTAVARRYAQALFSLAQEKAMMDQVESDLGIIMQRLADNANIRRVVEHQDIAPERKVALVQQVFGGTVSPLTLNFVCVVVSKRREDHLREMYKQYVELANDQRGVLEAEVRSAVAMSPEQIDALASRLGNRLGKTLRLQAKVEPELMGGIVVRVGDTLLDGSVRTRLKRLRERLVQRNDVQA